MFYSFVFSHVMQGLAGHNSQLFMKLDRIAPGGSSCFLSHISSSGPVYVFVAVCAMFCAATARHSKHAKTTECSRSHGGRHELQICRQQFVMGIMLCP